MDLTKEEKTWLRQMQKLLDKCPKHFEFNTVGDPDLVVFDNRKTELIEEIYNSGNSGNEFIGAIYEADAIVGHLLFPNNVHSTAG